MPIDYTKNYRWVRVSKAKMAKGSFRVKRVRGGLLRFACPKGKFKRGRCKVGMKLQARGYRR